MRHSVCKGAGVFCRDRPPRRIIQPPGTDASASQTYGHDPRDQTNRQKRTQTAAKVNPTAPGHPAPASLTPCALSNTRGFGGIDLHLTPAISIISRLRWMFLRSVSNFRASGEATHHKPLTIQQFRVL